MRMHCLNFAEDASIKSKYSSIILYTTDGSLPLEVLFSAIALIYFPNRYIETMEGLGHKDRHTCACVRRGKGLASERSILRVTF